MPKNLLSISELGADGLQHLLLLTESFRAGRKENRSPALKDKRVAMAFWEDSTRTRLSFETAAKNLSADIISFGAKGSAVSKGESLRDTAETLEALGADCLIVRHSSSGAPLQISRWVKTPVINAGDGCNAHPTQALLDCYTIKNHLGSLEGLRILIVGDIAHSRVARSCIRAFNFLGASVSLCAPSTLMPPEVQTWDVEIAENLEDSLERADVVYLLRIQKERQTEALLPSLREYQHRFGITSKRATLLKDHALIMHPGPINRGVEIDNSVACSERAVVTDQVRNATAVRMAVLYDLLAEDNGAH